MIAPSAALLIIDMQRAIDDPSWGVRNNPEAEARGLALLEAWRDSGRKVYIVRHDSTEPASTYRPGQPGHDFKPGFAPADGDTLIAKHANSAFIGTGLEARLREAGHTQLVIFGVITNNSVEATVRMAGNLGFDTLLAEDCCFTFARRDWNGIHRTAAEVHALSLANLAGEYCRVVDSASLRREL